MVFVCLVQVSAGLGSGFTTFSANEKSLRIILKTGLLPATMPIRLVQIAEEQAVVKELLLSYFFYFGFIGHPSSGGFSEKK